jgi:SAM-dependent methyltransferase
MKNENLDSEQRFGFGENWKEFIESSFTTERLGVAKSKLLETLQLRDLRGKTFLDVGCGSGIHSLAALKAEATRVVSFDYDPASVQTTQLLRERAGNPSHWIVGQGSVLDRSFMESLGKFDIVYSWGVLHHTGNMWEAIRNVPIPLAPNGALFIALYSYTIYQDLTLRGYTTPEGWLVTKQRYNRADDRQKRIMEWQYVLGPKWWLPWFALLNFLRFKRNQATYIRCRGMEIWTDVRDWLGGWPMEFVNEMELIALAKKELKLNITEMITGEGNTEFVFIPEGSSNWLSELHAKRSRLALSGPFQRAGDNAWCIHVPQLRQVSGEPWRPSHSSLRLFEDGQLLSFAHASPKAIKRFGGGTLLSLLTYALFFYLG